MIKYRGLRQVAVANLVLGIALIIVACGGGSSGSRGKGGTPSASNPVPTITNLSPSSATAGAVAQTLNINGNSFLSSSTVTYNGVAHAPTFVNSTQLTITLSASDQATAGTYAVVVTNPAPGGGPSNSLSFTVNNPVPGITSLSPSSATAGETARTLTINGNSFLSSSTVTYKGTARTPTLVNSTQLTITLSASDQATAGTYSVVVTNPAPGGGPSNALSFTVNNPAPSITSLSPSSATIGAAARTLTINGNSFLSSSTVTYKGTARTPTLVNSTQLTITLSASDQAMAGTYSVMVTNPAPGGGPSNALNFAVTPCSADPQSQTVTAPETATFCVNTTSSSSYQWYKNGAAISGATLPSYTTPPTTWGTNGAGFSVTVSDKSGSHSSTTSILTVNPAPTVNLSPVGPVLIGGQPQSQTVVAGSSATFNATAIGTEPITYQWNNNGIPINGATSATYTTPATTSADNGESFTVTATNSVNSLTSAPATLIVKSTIVSPAIQSHPQYIAPLCANNSETPAYL